MDTSILGIDVASRKLDLAWPKPDGFGHASIEYSETAIQQFLNTHSFVTPDSCTIGLESTGDYHLAVSQYFIKKGFTVKLINPILTKQHTKYTIRGTKTDTKDAESICKLVADGEGEQVSLDDLTNKKKELLRLAHFVTQSSSKFKLRISSVKRKQLPDMEHIEAKLEQFISQMKSFAAELVDEVTQDQSEEEKIIMSIPGFGKQLAASVHHELGDISRFDNRKALIAYAGLDPTVRQSGQLHTTGRISKRGPSQLRRALFLAAQVSQRFDPEMRRYYEKKKRQGRSHREILCIIGRKLLLRINACITENRNYVIRNQGLSP